jgi:hypothetical protein
MRRASLILGALSALCFLQFAAVKAAEKQPGPRQPSIFTEALPPERLRSDLDFLFKTIEEVHPNMYAYVSQAEFSKYRGALYKQIARPMTRVEFYKEVAPVVAKLRNGHTFVRPFLNEFQKYVKEGGRVYPLSLRVEADSLVLTRSDALPELPAGSRVLEINGVAAGDFISRHASCFAAEGRDTNPAILGQGKVLWDLLWLDYGDAEPVKLRIQEATGAARECLVMPIPYEKVMEAKTASGPAKEENYAYRRLPEAAAALVTIRQFDDAKTFGAFLRDTFKDIKDRRVQNLILDVRGNPGGVSNVAMALVEFLTDKPVRQFDEFGIKFSSQYCKANPGVLEQFQRDFPQKKIAAGSFFKFRTADWPAQPTQENPLRFKGRVLVLIDGGSASTTVMFAATIRGMGIGELIGTETMDTTSVYGECFNITLPNTEMQVSVADKYFLLVGGKDDGRGVLPDHEVKQNREDTAKGVDTALQYALALIASGK